MPALNAGRRDSDLVYDLGFHDGSDTAFYLGRGYRVVAVDANPEAIREGGLSFAPQLRDGRLTPVNVAIVENGQTEATLYYLKIDIEGMDEVALESLASTSVRPRFISVESECTHRCQRPLRR